MEQKVPFGPSWARAKWDFLLHLEKRPDPRGAARAGKRSAPTPGRAGPGAVNEKGPSFRRAPGRSGGEARIRTGGKGFAGLCLTTWPLRRKRTA